MFRFAFSCTKSRIHGTLAGDEEQYSVWIFVDKIGYRAEIVFVQRVLGTDIIQDFSFIGDRLLPDGVSRVLN